MLEAAHSRALTRYAVCCAHHHITRPVLPAAGCQALRILSFMSTVLPGPAHHCLADAPTATLAWPRHWWQHLVVNLGRQTSHSCGDLIFSSHITFILSFVICHTYYSKVPAPAPRWHLPPCSCLALRHCP